MQIHWSRHDRQGAARVLALGALLLGGLAACDQVSSPEISHAENVVDGGGIGGTVRDLEGRPVAGARVRTASGAQTITDAAGQFRLSGLAATPRLPVTIEAPGFDPSTKIFEVRTGVELSAPINIQPQAAPVVIDAGAGGSVPFAGGGRVDIPANAFAGLGAGDPVTVRATYIDPANAAQFSTASGDFSARTFSGANVLIESFGMVTVDARDAQGQRLDLNNGQQAVIDFPLRGGAGVPSRELWDFDTQSGQWVEVGSATVTPTSMIAPVTSVARPKNVDVPFRPVCITVRTLRVDKVTPRPNQYVLATGISYAGSSQGWTNTQGLVQLQVRSASQVLIQSGPAQQAVNTPAPGTPGCPLVATLAF